MPTHRRSLERLTPTELGEILKKKPDTVRRLLDRVGLEPVQEDGRGKRYDALEALSALFSSERLDLTAERARLAKEQADTQELKNAELRGELVPRGDHESVVISLASAVALRLDAIPSKATPEVRAAGSDAEGETILRTFIDEACTELADLGAHLLAEEQAPSRRPRRARCGAGDVPAAPPADGQPVG